MSCRVHWSAKWRACLSPSAGQRRAISAARPVDRPGWPQTTGRWLARFRHAKEALDRPVDFGNRRSPRPVVVSEHCPGVSGQPAGSTVDDALFTNSPIALSLASTTLLYPRTRWPARVRGSYPRSTPRSNTPQADHAQSADEDVAREPRFRTAPEGDLWIPVEISDVLPHLNLRAYGRDEVVAALEPARGSSGWPDLRAFATDLRSPTVPTGPRGTRRRTSGPRHERIFDHCDRSRAAPATRGRGGGGAAGPEPAVSSVGLTGPDGQHDRDRFATLDKPFESQAGVEECVHQVRAAGGGRRRPCPAGPRRSTTPWSSAGRGSRGGSAPRPGRRTHHA